MVKMMQQFHNKPQKWLFSSECFTYGMDYYQWLAVESLFTILEQMPVPYKWLINSIDTTNQQ